MPTLVGPTLISILTTSADARILKVVGDYLTQGVAAEISATSITTGAALKVTSNSKVGLHLVNGTLESEGTVPTIPNDGSAGDGTCTIDATSTDVAGSLTFANTWANADTVVVTFSSAYATAPKVILGHNSAVNGGITGTSTTTFTFTATGTCSGRVDYLVVESV